MPSPFPGMDPWLEGPAEFLDIHDALNIYLRDALNADALLREKGITPPS